MEGFGHHRDGRHLHSHVKVCGLQALEFWQVLSCHSSLGALQPRVCHSNGPSSPGHNFCKARRTGEKRHTFSAYQGTLPFCLNPRCKRILSNQTFPLCMQPNQGQFKSRYLQRLLHTKPAEDEQTNPVILPSTRPTPLATRFGNVSHGLRSADRPPA
jgi:hypothetical protein